MDPTSPNQPGSAHNRDDRSPPPKRIRRRTQSWHDQQRRETGLMRQNADHNAPSFVGSSSGIHFVRSVYSAAGNPRLSSAVTAATPDKDVVPGEEDHLLGERDETGSANLWRSSEVEAVNLQSNAEATVLNYDDLIAWSRSYFDHWHPMYPFLHAPSVLEWLETTSQLGLSGIHDGMQSARLTIIRCIMSMSLADRRQAGGSSLQKPVPASLVFESFKSAMHSIQDTLYVPASVESLQAVVGVQLFLVSMLRHNGASRLGGLIVRVAFQMGLHRCPARYAAFSKEEAELRQRLFWSIYTLDRHICLSLGLPLTIRDDDLDVCYLNEERHLAESTEEIPIDSRLSLICLLAKNAELRGMIMELRNKSLRSRPTDSNSAAVIAGRVTKWANEVDDILDSDSDRSAPFRDVHLTMLTILKQEGIILLNRPTLATSKSTSEYAGALQACIAASRAVITTSYRYLRRNEAQSMQTSAGGPLPISPLVWPSLTWNVWMSAFIVLYAAIEEEVRKAIALRLVDQAIEVLAHLSGRGSLWPSACAVAIQELRGRLAQMSTALPVVEGTRMGDDQNGDRLDHSTTHSQAEQSRPGSNPTALNRTTIDSGSALGLEPYSNSPSVTRDFGATPLLNPPNASTEVFNNLGDTHQPPFQDLWQQNLQAITGHQLIESIPWISNGNMGSDSVNLFEGFDIPFWMGDDQNAAFMGGFG